MCGDQGPAAVEGVAVDPAAPVAGGEGEGTPGEAVGGTAVGETAVDGEAGAVADLGELDGPPEFDGLGDGDPEPDGCAEARAEGDQVGTGDRERDREVAGADGVGLGAVPGVGLTDGRVAPAGAGAGLTRT